MFICQCCQLNRKWQFERARVPKYKPEYKPGHREVTCKRFSRIGYSLLTLLCIFLPGLISAARAEVTILDVRAGLHPDKTRVVLELNKVAFYQISYIEGVDSAKEREIVIDLRETPDREKMAALASRAGGIGLLERIVVEDNAGSTRFRIILRKAAVIDRSFTLKPDLGHAFRLVFDLKAVSTAEWKRLVRLTALPPKSGNVSKDALEPAPASSVMKIPEHVPPVEVPVVPEIPPESSPVADEPPDDESYDDMMTGDSNFTLSGYVEVEVRGFTQSAMDPGPQNWTTSFALEPLLEYVSDSSNSQFTFRPFGRVDIHDRDRSHFDIRELKWTGTMDRWQVTVGIDTLFWGVTESNHLVDIINQDDNLEDIDREDKLGQPLASVSYDSDFGVFSLYAMTYFREQRFPGRNGRLRLQLPVDTSQTQYEAGAGKWHTDLAIRWSHVIGDFDVGLYHFRGTDRQPEFIFGADGSGNPVLIPRYNLINQTGLDIQGTFEDLLVKFEGIRRTGSAGDYWAMTGGFEYTFYGLAGGDSDIGLLAEYLYDDRGQRATTPFDNDLFMGLRWAMNDIDSTEILFGAVVDLDTAAKFVNFESSRRIGDKWKVSLDARFFLGFPVNDPLFALSRDDFFQIRLARYF